jgi:hypothetical protein
MTFTSPAVRFEEKRNITRDEWIPLALLFIAYCYSQYSLNRTVNKCEDQGGVAEVNNYVFGLIWKVKCFDK